MRRVFCNFHCTIETEAFLDSFLSIMLTSENEAMSEMPEGNRYFKVVEDKDRYQKKGSKRGNEGCVTNWLGKKKNLSGFQGQIGWKSGCMGQVNTYWRFIRGIGRRWGKCLSTMIRIIGRAERNRTVHWMNWFHFWSTATHQHWALKLMHSQWMSTKDVQRC